MKYYILICNCFISNLLSLFQKNMTNALASKKTRITKGEESTAERKLLPLITHNILEVSLLLYFVLFSN